MVSSASHETHQCQLLIPNHVVQADVLEQFHQRMTETPRKKRRQDAAPASEPQPKEAKPESPKHESEPKVEPKEEPHDETLGVCSLEHMHEALGELLIETDDEETATTQAKEEEEEKDDVDTPAKQEGETKLEADGAMKTEIPAGDVYYDEFAVQPGTPI